MNGWLQPCEACHERVAVVACTRIMKRYVLCRTDELKHGDFTCRLQEDGPRRGSTCQVEAIETEDSIHFRITLVIRRRDPLQLYSRKRIERVAHSLLRRAVDVPCERALCDLCAQDPGEPARLCPEHYLGREIGVL